MFTCRESERPFGECDISNKNSLLLKIIIAEPETKEGPKEK